MTAKKTPTAKKPRADRKAGADEKPPTSLGHFEHSQRADIGIADRVARPLKIVFLGAGSGFYETLLIDALNMPGADRGETAIVDIEPERLELAEQLGRKIVADLGKDWTVTASRDRRAVLAGADYVINCIEVSGVQTVRFDNDIPLKYGVDQCIGDTIGPGGLMKALRTVPVFLDVLKDVEALCPDAWVLNYTNPMSIMCLAAARASRAKVVGLCHGVQGTSHALARYGGVPYAELEWTCGGVNHLAWFTVLRHGGRDLYPALKEKARTDRALWEKDPVRFDVLEHFGYFITEGSGHDSEYLPYYRKRKDLRDRYCLGGYRGESGVYAREWPKWRKAADERRRRIIAGEGVGGETPWAKPLNYRRSWEYASWLIQALETNEPFVAHCTVPNRGGLIENLPLDGVVEVACVANRSGLHPTRFGPLPPQCAALCDSNMRMFECAATACVERSRAAAEHALMLDPLTAAVCSPEEIRRMFAELYEAERAFVPELT
jgi:alpha-galactosidase